MDYSFGLRCDLYAILISVDTFISPDQHYWQLPHLNQS